MTLTSKVSPMPTLTEHARLRASQRYINEHQIEYALRCGHRVHYSDAVYFVVSEKPMFANQEPPSEQSKWVVLVATKDRDAILTCYRNEFVVRRLLSCPR